MTEDIECIYMNEGEMLRDNYKIKEILFASELSLVYLGYDLKKQQKCMIKEYFPNEMVSRDPNKRTVLCKELDLREEYYSSLESFLNEAVILKQFNHKNIARQIDNFMENNTGYIITEYYEGLTLEEYVKEEIDISIKHFLERIYMPLINAVIAMHDKGILHRDIKPANIIICEKDMPIIIDLGSAICFKECENKKMFVTPGFSPLEFYSEKSHQGKFSDIYGLTATIYYYLCGIVPEDATQRAFDDNLENIRKYNDEISIMFSKVIMKNLSLDYKKRFSSLRLFKLFVYIEYIILKAKDKIVEYRGNEN